MTNVPCEVWILIMGLGLASLFLGYKIKADKKSIQLEKNDKQQGQRIEKLEEKNGKEQRQLDEQATEIKELKKDKSELKDIVIKLQERIINCEKNRNKPKSK